MNKSEKIKLIESFKEELSMAKSLANKKGYFKARLEKYVRNKKFTEAECINKKQILELIVLYEFISKNYDLSNEDLTEILKSSPISFAFLRKVNLRYKNLTTHLRANSVEWLIMSYFIEKKEFEFSE